MYPSQSQLCERVHVFDTPLKRHGRPGDDTLHCYVAARRDRKELTTHYFIQLHMESVLQVEGQIYNVNSAENLSVALNLC